MRLGITERSRFDTRPAAELKERKRVECVVCVERREEQTKRDSERERMKRSGVGVPSRHTEGGRGHSDTGKKGSHDPFRSFQN